MATKMSTPANLIAQFNKPTPQAKIIETTTKFGAKGIRKQQGSTIVKYDILPLPEGLIQPTFSFFIDSNLRTFPFTNVKDGQLQVGEAMALERAYFFIVTQLVATGEFTDVETLDTFGIPGAGLANFDFVISNNRVVKPTPLTSAKPQFNRFAYFDDYNVYHFDTDIVIPTLIEFALNLKLPLITVPVSETLNYYIGCVIEGAGSILAPRSTF